MGSYNPFSIEGKQILVTGAGSGIGRAVSVEASKLGAKVILLDINKEALDETAALLEGTGHTLCQVNLLDTDSIKSFVNRVCNLDGLVNNAGMSHTKPLRFISEGDFDKVISLNTKAPFLLTNLLYKRKKFNRNASIVFTSSLAGLYTFTPANGLYSLTKSALTSYAKSCAVEFAGKGIRVNSVNPSMVNTHLKDALSFSQEEYEKDIQKYPLKRYAEPEDIAYSIIFLLSNASSYITGHALLVDGGRSLK